MARLAIRLLGTWHITLDGEPITRFESNKVRALLAWLVMEPHQAHSRERLAGLLWPDQPEPVARHSLRQALANLRQTLGDRESASSFLRITPGTVQFDPNSDYRLDASRFEALIASSEAHTHACLETCARCIGQLEEAVELYRGEFLAGLYVDDSVAFEEWAVLQRERFHTLVLDKLYHLANHSERRRDYDRARCYAQRQVELEPWREEAHRQLMRLLARSGQRSAALAQYERCRRALADELGVEPDDETQALYERIRATRSASPHHLPGQLTPFFGRKEDLAEIADRLADPACRLLTLVGPGGIGKTRLALHAASEQVGSFLNGVFFVSLAAISSPRFLIPAIAEVIGLTFSGDRDPQVQLLDYMCGKEMLLVLDSLEDLLPPAAPPRAGAAAAGSDRRGEGCKGSVDLLLAILTQAPATKILATSREPLRLRAEWLFEVRGLALPEPQATAGLETYSAVQLFIETARRVNAGLALTGEVAASAVRICRLVEGMPLGIELAAAAVQAWPCEQIAAQIEQDLDFLATAMHDVPARHRSMRAVFDDSWRRLSEAEQQAAEKLSVLRSPFAAEAARAVAGASPDTLVTLANRSFLALDQAGRYHMHPLVKQYSTQRLAQAPRQQEATRARHCHFYADFLHCREEALQGSRQRETLAEIGWVIDDIRAAWEWAVTHRDLATISLALDSLFQFYWARNWFQEGAGAFEQAAGSVQGSSPGDSLLLARIWVCQAEFYSWLGRYDPAKALLQRSIGICREQQAPRELAMALMGLGSLAYWLGDYALSGESLRKALDIFRQAQDKYRIAQCLNGLAMIICEETADLNRAAPLYEESLALARQVGDQMGEATVLVNQGGSAHEHGNYAEAQRLYQESLALYRAFDYRRGISAVLNNLGQLARVQGDYASARELIQESLDLKRETGNRSAMISSLLELGNLTCQMAEYAESSRWYSQALTLAWEMHALHNARYALVGAAELLDRQGQQERALELLCFVRHQPVGEQMLIDQVDGLITQLQETVAADKVVRCRERGQAMTLEAVVHDVLYSDLAHAHAPRQ